MSFVNWKTTYAAVWRVHTHQLRPISRLDPVRLTSLLGVERQKQALLSNTQHFLQGKPSNHTLLWGSRGTGKSSLIKALLNELAPQGLRVVQVDKEDLLWLPEILDLLEAEPYRFIIFCDDMSFEEGEVGYKPLKSILEGGLELPPEHVRIYATSNRRHLLPEHMSDNQQTQVVDGEIHYADAVEDKMALSDRFGLWLSFYPASWDTYFTMVDQLFGDVNADRSALHQTARLFAMGRASHSGRTAKQFYQHYLATLQDS
ncbi:ATP-binding protein [Pokkaliibacter sp. MBI-7]|uniref:ATP-binding protein n=1 Tax=Pokkaliibacter sp. MBI-7 TaxID=3040600 RepID=UPI00244BF268|nr:ATP-binding protein [Pokkaliibacter sp. MBI-7]MDH2434550.1 ATP-binding protein [Pokkaliibacter sp. MBI-7]